MDKQKFAWIPTVVWNMKTRWYRNTVIWLCWYWEDEDKKEVSSTFYRLSDDPNEEPMTSHPRCRTSTNRW